MRNARYTRLFICCTRTIPEHMDHDGGAVIFDHDDLKPVVQREMADIILGQHGRSQPQSHQPCKNKTHEMLLVYWVKTRHPSTRFKP